MITLCIQWTNFVYDKTFRLLTSNLRASPANSSNFCTIWRMNIDFYLYLPTFSNTLSNKFYPILYLI